MGYANESILEESKRTAGKMQPEGHTLFYKNDAKIEHVIDANETGGKIAAHSLDCSPG